MSPSPKLRPYQQDSLNAVTEALAAGHNRQLMKKPTGTGKTVTFAAMLEHPPLKSWLEQFPKDERKMLVIAHREELLEQAAEKIQRANPHHRVSIEQGSRVSTPFADVVIASIQTLAAVKFRRLRRLLNRHTFRVVIVDEAHHAAASTYRTALALLGFLPMADASTEENVEAADFDDIAVMEQALAGWDGPAPKDRLLLGVTATPNRTDAIGLGCVFQTISYSYGLKDAIDDGWLVPIVPWVIETASSLDEVRVHHGEFNQRQLAEAVNVEARNQLAVAGWNEHAEGLSTIAFTVDVAHAHALAAAFQTAGIKALPLSGETPRDDRRMILEQMRNRQIDIVTNCMVLTEGTDLPMVSCILHAKPTKSATLYEQMTGRGLRIHPGKAECIVIDLVDVARRHSLMAAPVLYGLPPGIKTEGQQLEDLRQQLEDFRDKHPAITDEAMRGLTLEQLRARASTFDVWTVPDMGIYGAGRALQWIRSSETAFRVTYPWRDQHETILVEPDLIGKFDVKLSAKLNGWASTEAPRVLAAGVSTAEAALGLAEAFVAQERQTVMRLVSAQASWRSRPASPGQTNYLRKLRVPFRSDITSGEASSLIDLAKAKGRGGR